MDKIRLIMLTLAISLLCGCYKNADSFVPSQVPNESTENIRTEALSFPRTLTDSPLVIEKTLCYYGPYWEDGSGEKVENVAALMLYNPTDRLVESAAFAMEQDGKTLYFFVCYLPPESRCLVLDKNRQSWNPDGITDCRELGVRWSYRELYTEQIHYVGLGPVVTVVNQADCEVERTKIWYKHYESQKDCYLGGAAFSANLLHLQPQEQRTIQPEHYHSTNTRIVGIELEM